MVDDSGNGYVMTRVGTLYTYQHFMNADIIFCDGWEFKSQTYNCTGKIYEASSIWENPRFFRSSRVLAIALKD